jgi:hypothetical protein
MKKVYIRSHGPLWWPDQKVGWEDVWLRFHVRRRTVYMAPCLVSREHLKSDIAIYTSIANDPKAPTRLFHREAVKELEALLRQLDDQPVVVLQHQPGTKPRPDRDGYGLAEVYTRQPWIDKAEAQRMLDVYLGAMGIRDCHYKWKRPALVAMPITVAA